MPECRQSISASWPRACHITLLYRSSRFSSHSPQPSRLCLYQTYSTRSSRSWPSSSHRIVWGLVRTVLKDVITPHGGSLLSVGILATIWAASGGVAALIEAVNVAYDLPDKRSFVQRRLLAIALMFAVGALAVAALSLLVVGPGFGRWLAGRVGLSAIFVALWPYLRWVLSVSCAVLSIELIYMWAPSSRRPFRSSLPGAVIALASWLTLSSALGLYLRNFGRLNKTYGTLAAAVALMAWLYWTAFAILVGAQVNSETIHLQETGTLPKGQSESRPATAA